MPVPIDALLHMKPGAVYLILKEAIEEQLREKLFSAGQAPPKLTSDAIFLKWRDNIDKIFGQDVMQAAISSDVQELRQAIKETSKMRRAVDYFVEEIAQQNRIPIVGLSIFEKYNNSESGNLDEHIEYINAKELSTALVAINHRFKPEWFGEYQYFRSQAFLYDALGSRVAYFSTISTSAYRKQLDKLNQTPVNVFESLPGLERYQAQFIDRHSLWLPRRLQSK